MKKSYEEELIAAIQTGDLASVKTSWIGKNDIDRPFIAENEIEVINKSNVYPFPSIKHPTIVIYTILCEQPEILQYILETKHPNLFQYVNGWAAIHYAACTKDPECMKVLLKYQSIQENIDFPIIDPINAPEGHFTTALHVATTNLRHPQVLLLTQPLQSIEYDGNFSKIDTNANHFKYKSANVLQKSSIGNMPIHIAVRQNNWDLCQILLAAYFDVTVLNDKGQTPIDIAVQFKKNEIKANLETVSTIRINELKNKYLKQKEIPVVVKNTPEKTEKEENSEIIEEYQETVSKLSQTIDEISQRVVELEQKTTVPKENSIIKNIDCKPCCCCGSLQTTECMKCYSYFCHNCFNEASHECN